MGWRKKIFPPRSEEERHARALEKEAYKKGVEEARAAKLRSRVEKARKKGYRREMEGHGVKGALMGMGKVAWRGVEEAGKITKGLEKMEKQQKKRRKKDEEWLW